MNEEIKKKARLSVGEQLRKARQKKGLTLRDLSEKVGLAYNHIGRVEAGKYNVTLDTIAIIANALDVNIVIDEKNV